MQDNILLDQTDRTGSDGDGDWSKLMAAEQIGAVGQQSRCASPREGRSRTKRDSWQTVLQHGTDPLPKSDVGFRGLLPSALPRQAYAVQHVRVDPICARCYAGACRFWTISATRLGLVSTCSRNTPRTRASCAELARRTWKRRSLYRAR